MQSQFRTKSKTLTDYPSNYNSNSNNNNQALEDFYQLKSPGQLAKIILDKTRAYKFFSEKKQQKITRWGIVFNSTDQKKQIEHKEQLINIAKKHTIEQVYNMYYETSQKNVSNDPKKIFRYQIQHQILNDQQRLLVWKMAGKVIFNMEQNKHYYDNLLNSANYPDNCKRQIINDCDRTKFTMQERSPSEIADLRQKLYRILLGYSRRNSILGYCQGYNYIVSTFLQLGFEEEECFWLFVHLIEQIVPIDYYDSMLFGVICDQKIFNRLLEIELPQLSKYFDECNFPTSLILIQWFVCLYAQTLSIEVLKVAWDHLFLKGSVTLFKIGLFILQNAQKKLFQVQQPQFFQVIEQAQESIKDPVQLNKKLGGFYISKKGIMVLREIYGQLYKKETEKLDEGKKNCTYLIDYQKIYCEKNWPYCMHLYMEEKQKKYQEIDFFAYQNSLDIQVINDYYPSVIIDMNKVRNKSRSSMTTENLSQSFTTQASSSDTYQYQQSVLLDRNRSKKDIEKERKQQQKELKKQQEREKKERAKLEKMLKKQSKSLSMIDFFSYQGYQRDLDKAVQDFKDRKFHQKQVQINTLENKTPDLSRTTSNNSNQSKILQKDDILITRTDHKCLEFSYEKRQVNPSGFSMRSYRSKNSNRRGKYRQTRSGQKVGSKTPKSGINSFSKTAGSKNSLGIKSLDNQQQIHSHNNNNSNFSYNFKMKIEENEDENDSHSSSDEKMDQKKQRLKRNNLMTAQNLNFTQSPTDSQNLPLSSQNSANIPQQGHNFDASPVNIGSNNDGFLDLQKAGDDAQDFQIKNGIDNNSYKKIIEKANDNEDDDFDNEFDDEYDEGEEFDDDDEEEDQIYNLNSQANSQEIDSMIKKMFQKNSSRINQFFDSNKNNSESEQKRQQKLKEQQQININKVNGNSNKHKDSLKKKDKGFSSDVYQQPSLLSYSSQHQQQTQYNQDQIYISKGSDDSGFNDSDDDIAQDQVQDPNKLYVKQLDQQFAIKFLRTLSMQPERKNFTRLLNIDRNDQEIISHKELDQLLM